MAPRKNSNQDVADTVAALASEDAEKDALRLKVSELERQIFAAGDLKGQLVAQKKAYEILEQEFNVLTRGKNIVDQPNWVKSPGKSRSKHNAIATLFLSDLHLDEVVNPSEVNYVNAYNREIAEFRLKEIPQNFIKMCRDGWGSYVTYDGIILPLGGDIFSGEIHAELTQTNADVILSSFYHWIKPMASVISVIADEFGKVHVPVVVGNHPRRSIKPRSKFRARDNFDWLLGMILADNLAGDSRITFQIPDSADCRYRVYDKHILLTHGDQVTGGQGVGGIWPPIKRMVGKKRAQYDATGQPIDQVIMGHWHQLIQGGEFVVNSSLKGYDEYAMIGGFSYEVPQQAAWLSTAEHGVTWTAPIFCQDREVEGW